PGERGGGNAALLQAVRPATVLEENRGLATLLLGELPGNGGARPAVGFHREVVHARPGHSTARFERIHPHLEPGRSESEDGNRTQLGLGSAVPRPEGGEAGRRGQGLEDPLGSSVDGGGKCDCGCHGENLLSARAGGRRWPAADRTGGAGPAGKRERRWRRRPHGPPAPRRGRASCRGRRRGYTGGWQRPWPSPPGRREEPPASRAQRP